jgi:hypothetical protein
VRFEAYYSINLVAAWKYPTSPFDFLPAFRLAKVSRFSDRNLPWLCSHNQCQNNGTCHIMNNGKYLCLCQRGWNGINCEKTLDHVKCASYSLARDRNICVCPAHGYLEPHCFVRNAACERRHSCSLKEACYSATHQPPDWYRCPCNASSCDTRKSFIIMHRQEPNHSHFFFNCSKYPRIIHVYNSRFLFIRQPIFQFLERLKRVICVIVKALYQKLVYFLHLNSTNDWLISFFIWSISIVQFN